MASKAATQRVESNGKKDRQKINMERRKKHDRTVGKATAKNLAAGFLGQVRVAQLPGVNDDSKTWPHREGFKNINVGPGSRGEFRQLMTCNLGPIPLKFKGDKTSADVKNVENIWQFSKVFAQDIGLNEKPTPDWFAARLKGWADPKGYQRAKKKQVAGVKPVFFFWGREDKLEFIEARKRIFCRVYAMLATRTAAYRKLVELIQKGTNVQILGLEGYDYVQEQRSLNQCLLDPERGFGPAFVLAGLLTKDLPWVQKFNPAQVQDGRPVSPSEKVLDPILPTGTKTKRTSTAALPNGDDVEKKSSSSTTTSRTKRKKPALTPQERNVHASETASQKIEASGSVKPPPRKRSRRNGHKEVPLFIVMNADKAGKIPSGTKFFLSLPDATEELHRNHKEEKPRAMMIWRCGAPADD